MPTSRQGGYLDTEHGPNEEGNLGNNHTELTVSAGRAMKFVNTRTVAEPVARLTVERLTLVRGDRCLADALNFNLSAGLALQITGPNGCGKTTLLRAVAGLSRPEAGTVVWSGAHGPLDEPPRIAWLGHRNGLKADMTPREELAFSRRLHGDAAPESIADCLHTLGLEHCADLPCGQLSAGQQRRIALARVLLVDAPVWILDEPLTALDAQACSHFQTVLAQHLQRGGLALLSTHQPLTLDTDRLQSLAWGSPC